MREHFIPRSILQPSLLPALVRKVAYQPITLAVAATTVLTITMFSHLTAFRETATQEQIQARFQSFQAAIPLLLPTVNLNDAHERKEALQSMQLSVTEAKQVADNTKRIPESKLIWIEVWDDADEDGDLIEIKSINFTRTIPIFHTPQHVAIYVAPGEKYVVFTGLRDGYGGITASIITVNGIIQIPRLFPGQSIAIPFL